MCSMSQLPNCTVKQVFLIASSNISAILDSSILGTLANCNFLGAFCFSFCHAKMIMSNIYEEIFCGSSFLCDYDIKFMSLISLG